jgi:hypothetical protein
MSYWTNSAKHMSVSKKRGKSCVTLWRRYRPRSALTRGYDGLLEISYAAKPGSFKVGNTRQYGRKEIDVMFESDNTLFVTVYGNADALGDLTATNAITKTFAGGGVAIGFAGATAVAQGTAAAPPYTQAMTDGFADGGHTTSSHTSHMSIDFPYGPTPVSVSVSMTYVTTHGDFLSGYSLSGLIDGLL